MNVAYSYITGYINNFQLNLESQLATVVPYYLHPMVRINPYLFGGLFAFYLSQLQSNKTDKESLDLFNQIKKKSIVKLLKNLNLTIAILSPWMLLQYNANSLVSVTIHLLIRTCIACITCWFIVKAVLYRSTIGSSQLFRHISSISYALYLVHPIVILYFGYMSSFPIHFDPFIPLHVSK